MVGKTPQKSPYFEASDGEPSSEAEVSGYEDEDVSAEPSAEENMDDEVASEDERPESRRKRRKVNQKVVERVIKEEDEKGKELWRPDVAVDAEAGEAVFISLPKARSAGKTPYTPDTIHPNTLAFLGDLRRNNDREWLKMHDADYRQSKRDFDEFVDAVTPKLAEKDETIPELPHKDLTFRIYRDIRFSPDPTPYKTHFSAAWSRTGRKGPYAGYYVQVKPGASFLGAGLWCPEAAPLALLRAAVDRKSHRLKEVLMNERIRHEFMNGVRAKESECVKKFIAMNQENALKRKPKVMLSYYRLQKLTTRITTLTTPISGFCVYVITLSAANWPMPR